MKKKYSAIGITIGIYNPTGTYIKPYRDIIPHSGVLTQYEEDNATGERKTLNRSIYTLLSYLSDVHLIGHILFFI